MGNELLTEKPAYRPKGSIVFEVGAFCGLCYQQITDAKQMTMMVLERHADGAIPVIAAHRTCAEGMR